MKYFKQYFKLVIATDGATFRRAVRIPKISAELEDPYNHLYQKLLARRK